MEQDPISIITKKKCLNQECNENDLVFENIMTVGDISLIGKLEENEKYVIYKCEKCGIRYKIRKD